MGAHLDSWDLGVGAVDDGVGVVTMLKAAEAIVHGGVQPLRTIRVLLFTGENKDYWACANGFGSMGPRCPNWFAL